METLARARLTASRSAQSRRTERPTPSAAALADPATYAGEVFGLTVWPRQAELLRSVLTHGRVSVTSGHKTGKTTSFAILAWWFTADPAARPGARVPMTSSSFRQVIRTLWREVTALWRRARERGYDLPEPALSPDTGVRWSDGREIFGFSTKDPEKAAGTSGAHILYLVDEASGVPDRVFEALEGNRAGGRGAKIMLASNPTQQSGVFFESHHTKRHLYLPLSLSSEAAAEHADGIPGLATRSWVEEKRVDWGPDWQTSPIYAVRVLGRFPETASDAVIGLSLVLAAIARHGEVEPDGPLVVGLDVARFGDDETVAAPRRGKHVFPLLRVAPGDGPETASRFLLALRESKLLRPGEKPQVNVDANGVGAAVYDALSRSDAVRAVAVNTSSASSNANEFLNLRAELHFAGRDWLREGGAIPDDGKLQAEMVAPKYRTDARGRLQVESKDDLKKRLPGGRSPDACDAWLLSLYVPPPPALTKPSTRSRPAAWGF